MVEELGVAHEDTWIEFNNLSDRVNDLIANPANHGDKIESIARFSSNIPDNFAPNTMIISDAARNALKAFGPRIVERAKAYGKAPDGTTREALLRELQKFKVAIEEVLRTTRYREGSVGARRRRKTRKTRKSKKRTTRRR